MILKKRNSAERQLNYAIRAFFKDQDLIVIYTLTGAAGNIFHDLVEKKNPMESWEMKIAEDNDISIRDFMHIFRKTQNFLKHADQDPDGILEIEPDDIEHLIFFIIQNWCELNEPGEMISIEASTFQLWYLAKRKSIFRKTSEHHGILQEVFPNLLTMDISTQKSCGLKF